MKECRKAGKKQFSCKEPCLSLALEQDQVALTHSKESCRNVNYLLLLPIHIETWKESLAILIGCFQDSQPFLQPQLLIKPLNEFFGSFVHAVIFIIIL